MTILGGAFRPALASLGLVLLTACATASSPDEMSVAAGALAAPAPGSRSDHSFRLGDATGGGSTSAIGLSDVSDEALRKALSASLRNLGYLADDPSKAAYVVSADLVDLDRPVAALDPALLVVPIDLSVTVRIRYTVSRAQGGPPLFNDIVATTATATVDDALTPAGRVRKANEAAMRLNTIAFLQRLEADWK
jgi:hypothetical protein